MDNKNLTIEKILTIAVQNHQKNNFKAAEELYHKILKINPLHFQTIFLLGTLSAQTKDYEKAQQLLNKAIQMDSNHVDSLNALGTIQKELRKYQKAISYYQKIIQIDPNYAIAHNNLATVLIELGDFEKARSCCEKAIQIQPDYAHAYNNLGAILNKLGEFEKAANSFQKAIQINPDYANAHNNLGVIHRESGRNEEAKSCYEKAIDIQPNHADAYNNLGTIYKQSKDFQKAKKNYQKAIEIQPNHIEAYINLGNVSRELGDLMDALKYFQKAVSISPNKKAIINLAFLFHATLLGNITQANSAEIKKLLILLYKRNDIDHRFTFRSAKLVLLAGKNLDQEKFRDAKLSLLTEGNGKQAGQKVATDSLLINNKVIKNLLKDEFFLLMLQKSLVADSFLEKILIKLRREILFTFIDSNEDILNKNFEFIISLAEQCFLNEYVFIESEKEMDYAIKLRNTIENNKEINELGIAILGCYFSLCSSEGITKKLLNYKSKNVLFNDLTTMQVKEPLKEKELLNSIKSLGNISDDISKKVRDQYEIHPYPRWRYTYLNICTNFLLQLNEQIAPNKIGINGKFNNPKVLVAGCGTGKHICIAQNYLKADILGIDLSLTSLAYAKRKIEELGFKNVEFLQADILQLKDLNKKFDVIECIGVLHHMKNPFEGLKVLLNLLEPHGFLKLGLYSEIARQHIIAARKFINKKEFKNTIKDIRNCRESIIKETENPLLQKVTAGYDFYSTSSVRDLIFHVQEHRFTIPQISKMLKNLNLEFLGFVNQPKKKIYSKIYSQDINNISLDNWNQFEMDNPTTFSAMYNFWVRKKI